MRPLLASLLALALMPGLAFAQVTQPNGLVVPRDSMNGETQLYPNGRQPSSPTALAR